MRSLPLALRPFAAYHQFILYTLVPSRSRPGKTDKFPCDWRTGRVTTKGAGGAHDPNIWLDFSTAASWAVHYGTGHGIGFVFTENDPFWFLDLDGCLQSDGTWSPLSRALLAALPGAAVEISSSGRGLHAFGTGAVPAHSCKPPPGSAYAGCDIEFYSTGRFAALTGSSAVGDAATDLSAALPGFLATVFPPSAAQATPTDWTDGPCDGWRGPVDDNDLLRRAMQSRSSRAAFGPAASFADLWEANTGVLACAYPDSERAYDASSADAALAQHLAFWTGKDCERIQRLMLQSGLVREKWEREDYLPRTISTACAQQTDVLTDKPIEPPTPGAASADPLITDATFLQPADQVQLFAGCTYVLDSHRILVPGGHLLKPDQFKVMYGGRSFVLSDRNGAGTTTRDAWDAFTQSQVLRHPRVDSTCFRPELPAGALLDIDGLSQANTWWPPTIRRLVGDATPFIRHMELLLPVESDRQQVMAFMAAIVQHQGTKFQWTILLQGVEGNGKTILTKCVAKAIGERYSYFPKARQIANQFNDWQYGCVFAGVEDIYVAESQREVMEELKPMVTGDENEIEGKGEKKATRHLCFNLILNSNHKDGVRKYRKDRRFAIYFTAQQEDGDLERCGMAGRYFPDLWNWLRADGYAIVAELLHTWPIPDHLNPATSCHRAPATSSTEEAIVASLGAVEQEILESIEQGLPGFADGWVSSIHLDRMIAGMRSGAQVPRAKRRALMQSLGFDWHPALHGGRVNNTVMPDVGKPRLYVKRGHAALALTSAADVARAYTLAQTPQTMPVLP